MVAKGRASSLGGEVELRDFKLDDLDDFYEWASNVEVTTMMTWEIFRCKEEARQFLLKTVIVHPWFKAICFKGKPIDHVMIKQGFGIHSCRAEMGYALSRKYWKLGFTTEAVIVALNMAFQELIGLQRVEALVLTENPASSRVLHKAGFAMDCVLRSYIFLKGRIRDCFLFSYVPTPLLNL